ncbi:MAG: PTS glucose transporter subunit IIA, partial [Clostridia bacterium]|nr:PTS glucose transporter subunit IIA [Clostridia bacterium]
MLTGITEPIEFTFLFVSPILYVIHCILAGLSYMLMHIFNVGVGMTFSGGIIDLTLFGILQGNAKTNWIWIVIVGLVYAVVYYFLFSIMIRKLNLKTPGREADDEETKLYTRKDVEARKAAKNSDDITSALILHGLGGKDNIADIDCCATRLRVTVKNPAHVSESHLKRSGASGVIRKGEGVQVIYGPRVSVVKSNLEDFIDSPASTRTDELIAAHSEGVQAENGNKTDVGSMTLTSPLTGKIVPLDMVEDDVFSQRMLGDGAAIEPSEGKLYSPCDGTIETVFDTRHAVNIKGVDGCEILLHIGIDTVKLNGKYFTAHVNSGQTVKRGDLLLSFDMKGIKNEGYKLTSPIVVCNSDEYGEIKTVVSGEVRVGRDLMRLTKKRTD